MSKESPLWNQLKISLVLQDKDSSKNIDWGRCYTTDDCAFDGIQFKTVVNNDSEDDE